MRIFLVLSVVIISLGACKSKKKDPQPPEIPTPPQDTVAVVDPRRDTILMELTNQVLTAFSTKDYAALSGLVHPDSGVRFSPYAYIDTASDKVVSADWIKKQADKGKQEKILWGTADPTDEPISMTMDKYVQRFVYDVDFLRPEKLKVNEFIGGGNTINNLLTVYQGCNFTESHFSGFEKKYEGMDWKSIRLVYKMKDGKYYLVGVVHDEWST